MRILFINQFYPPDAAPTGQVAHDLARCLVGRGHEVTVLSSQRGYAGAVRYAADEVLDGVRVRRVAALPFGPKSHARKVLSYASFYLGVAWRLATLRPGPAVVVSLTTPPYVGLLVRLAGLLRGWRRVHWIMDLYPDVMVAHGMLGSGRLGRILAGAMAWLTRREFARAGAVLTLGPDMAARCRRYVSGRTALEWVPLWPPQGQEVAAPAAAAALRRRRGWGDDEVVLMYSGNMGLGHRFGEFLETARRAAGEGKGEGEGGRARPCVGASVDSASVEPDSLLPAPRSPLPPSDLRPPTSDLGEGERPTLNAQCPTSKAGEGEGRGRELTTKGTKDTNGGREGVDEAMKRGGDEARSMTTGRRDCGLPAPRSRPPDAGLRTPSSGLRTPLCGVRFVFAGGGRRRVEVESFARAHPEARVTVMDYVPAEEVAAHLGAADVLLASLEPSWSGCMLPSKVASMLAVGRPVIFVGPSDSAPAAWIASVGAGWVVAPGDVEALMDCIREACDADERARRGAAARDCALRLFDRERNVERLAAMVEEARGGG